jgi:hypothetical protein
MPEKKLLFLTASFIFLSFLIANQAYSGEAAKCLGCHNAMKGRIKSSGGINIELNVDTERFNASVHSSLSCTDCHLRFSYNPHASPTDSVPFSVLAVSSKISSKYFVDPVAAAACSICHGDIYSKVLGSVHGKNIIEKKENDGALCLDCHGSPHYIISSDDPNSKISRENHVETCGKCHADKKIIKKYNLEENVMENFRESFHGKKLHIGHTGAPVCSSCHNAHDIKSKDNPASPVYGMNKLKTCSKCHEGANEKFIPAITHKPPGPIPHYAEIGLILLTMGVIAFVVLHVLLEAFSDIRDAIFRKTEN